MATQYASEGIVALILQVIQPSLEDIQNAVNIAVQCITDIGQYIQLWTIPSPASSLANTPRSANESMRISLSLSLSSLSLSFLTH